MTDRTPSKSEIFDNLQSQAQTLDELSKRITKIEQSSEKQEARNQNITIGVLFAFIAIVVAVAVQVSLSNRYDAQQPDNFLEKVNQTEISNLQLEEQVGSLTADNVSLKNQIDSIRQKNPYLK